jgi:hypothetical protein
MKYTLSRQIEEINRELDRRAHDYARAVIAGNLKQYVADYRIDVLTSVRDTLLQCQEKEKQRVGVRDLSSDQLQATGVRREVDVA